MTDPSLATFFSYSRTDSEFVLRLVKDLRAAGATVWLDQLDIRAGQHWDRAIEEALRASPRQVAILSPEAINSENVMDEISYALEKHKQVIPVLYRDCQIPLRLRRMQYIDFRSDYDRGLRSLLRAFDIAKQTDGETDEKQSSEQKQPAKKMEAQRANGSPNRSLGLRKTMWGTGIVTLLVALIFGGRWYYSRHTADSGKIQDTSNRQNNQKQGVPSGQVKTDSKAGQASAKTLQSHNAATETAKLNSKNPEILAGGKNTQETQSETQPNEGTAGRKKMKVNPRDGQIYVWIPPGTFQMGCAPEDNECYVDEQPSHSVKISKGFWMGETEVTQEAYLRIMGANPSRFRSPRLPVENVTFSDANAYCEAIGGRLPTEAEWEFAAKGGTTTSRYGNLDEIAWYQKNSEGHTHEVAQKKPNASGLYDMLGNAWEWVSDWYDPEYYKQSPHVDPKGPVSGKYRSVRGGSWIYGSFGLRASCRGQGNLDYSYLSFSFRCVRDAFP